MDRIPCLRQPHEPAAVLHRPHARARAPVCRHHAGECGRRQHRRHHPGGTAALPTSAAPGEPARALPAAGAFWRSNGDALGVSGGVVCSRAPSRASDLPTAQADKLQGRAQASRAPARPPATSLHGLRGGDEVGSSSYKTRNHALTRPAGARQHLVAAPGSAGHLYRELPQPAHGERRADSQQFNLRYQGQFGCCCMPAPTTRTRATP